MFLTTSVMLRYGSQITFTILNVGLACDEHPPFFGQFCCKIVIQPDSCVSPLLQARLRVKVGFTPVDFS